MATVGYVCLQWSRLEMGILGVIYTIEDMPAEKGEIIFGGLDILPRVNMAINLARYAKLPPRFTKRLTNVRKALQGGLCDRRNQVVHGAHRDMESDSTTLTMVRWKGDKRTKTLSAMDIQKLGNEIFELGNECWAIMEDLASWKFGTHSEENLTNPDAERLAAIRLKFTKRLNTRLNHLRADFDHISQSPSRNKCRIIDSSISPTIANF